MKQLHSVQLKILEQMLFARALKYTDMKPEKDMENNVFQYHLDQLIELGHLAKTDHLYTLTNSGKEYANRIDTEKTEFAMQAKLSAWICASRINKNKVQYLIYTRLKHPFYGCQGFTTGKIRFGETVIEAAKRELMEETSLIGKPKLVVIKHFRVFDNNKKNLQIYAEGGNLQGVRQPAETLLEDKFMFLCLVKDPKGKIISNKEGLHEWVNEDNLDKYITKPFESKEMFWQELNLAKKFNGHIQFIEEDHSNNRHF